MSEYKQHVQTKQVKYETAPWCSEIWDFFQKLTDQRLYDKFSFLKYLFKAVVCDFQQCGILTSVDTVAASFIISFKTPNDVLSVAQQSLNIQATSKGSDQPVRMHRHTRTLI